MKTEKNLSAAVCINFKNMVDGLINNKKKLETRKLKKQIIFDRKTHRQVYVIFFISDLLLHCMFFDPHFKFNVRFTKCEF